MTSPTLRTIAFRSLLAGLGVGAVAALGFNSLALAQAIAGHNSNGPVSYAADRIELQDQQNRVVLSGNVDITQGGLRLQAGRTSVAYTDNGSLQIQRIDASGGVVVTRGNESARGAVAVYDFARRMIVLSGGVSLKRGGDTLNGGRLVIDLNTGLSSIDGRAGGSSAGGAQAAPGGRVSGTFSVGQ